MAEPSGSKTTSGTPVDITVAVILLLILVLIGSSLTGFLEEYSGFLDWIYSKNWGLLLKVAAIVFTVLDVILFAFIIFTLRRLARLQQLAPQEEIKVHAVLPKEEVKESWEHIRELANSSSPSDWNMAVLRADALLDDILQHLNYEGTTLAERLKIVDPTKLPSLDNVWSAHRLRNAIAHDPLEQHTRESLVHALRSYEQALRELGMMDVQESS